MVIRNWEDHPRKKEVPLFPMGKVRGWRGVGWIWSAYPWIWTQFFGGGTTDLGPSAHRDEHMEVIKVSQSAQRASQGQNPEHHFSLSSKWSKRSWRRQRGWKAGEVRATLRDFKEGLVWGTLWAPHRTRSIFACTHKPYNEVTWERVTKDTQGPVVRHRKVIEVVLHSDGHPPFH